MTKGNIVACRIYPGIGIARLGDSPDSYFIGPETPGLSPTADAKFKDAQGRIRRQAARFRIFGVDANGNFVEEINSQLAGAKVEWTVAVANRKAAGVKFSGVSHDMRPGEISDDPSQLRNRNVTDRSTLEIVPSQRNIAGTNQGGDQFAFVDGSFNGRSVYLGELKTDALGRLVVLGGHGASGSMPGSRPLTQYADNDGWFDDTSDGRVSAKVQLDGRDIPLVAPSWVIVAPPKFAPFIRNVVPLYDVMAEAAGVPAPAQLSFTDHIYPHFAAFADMQWVNGMSLRGHGPQKAGNFRDPGIIQKLNDSSKELAGWRAQVFKRLRKPSSTDVAEASYNFMPALSGDNGDATIGKPATWLSLPQSTYKMLERWAKGDFDSDWPGVLPMPTTLENLPLELQPAALNKAALEPCVGGPFYPGIEITYFCRLPDLYSEPFRFDSTKLKPGDITQRMAVPWQADFYECQTHWWPAQRPDDVLNETTYLRALIDFPAEATAGELAKTLSNRIRWDRGVGDHWINPEADPPNDAMPAAVGDNDMVEQWKKMGFVVPVRTEAGETLHVETGRSSYDGLGDRDYFFYLLNIDSYPDFVPQARALAERFLSNARALLDDPTPGAVDDMYRYFRYSKDAFHQRLDEIYSALQAYAAEDPLTPDSPFQTREDMIERIRQFAPLNQLDGAWLRNVARAGPIDEVGSLLFSVWMDEVGDGNPSQNHANLYTRFMEGVGVQLPPINTVDYAYDPSLLDSAFTVPMFELAISEFTDSYYPEILGMTLQLEWEVLALWPTVKLLRNFEIDAHFYELHIGIDNAADGHGAKARDAVNRFLDDAYRRGGDAEVQAVWRRIWTGYVAFATTGTLGSDLRDLLDRRRTQPDTPADGVMAIIQEKKKYGSLNHRDKQAAGKRINDLFEEPQAFMSALVDGGYIVPGRPDQSPFFKLTSFSGPMYKVFSEDELKTIETWVISLGTGEAPPEKTPPAELMAACVDHFREQQVGTPTHQIVQLTGADPSNPGQTITQPLAAWFEAPTRVLLAALADPVNKLIVPSNSAKSPFVAKYLDGKNAMNRAFSAVAPNTGGKTWRDVVVDWINNGCPLPAANAARSLNPGRGPATRLLLTSSRAVEANHPRGRVQGMGTVH